MKPFLNHFLMRIVLLSSLLIATIEAKDTQGEQRTQTSLSAATTRPTVTLSGQEKKAIDVALNVAVLEAIRVKLSRENEDDTSYLAPYSEELLLLEIKGMKSLDSQHFPMAFKKCHDQQLAVTQHLLKAIQHHEASATIESLKKEKESLSNQCDELLLSYGITSDSIEEMFIQAYTKLRDKANAHYDEALKKLGYDEKDPPTDEDDLEKVMKCAYQMAIDESVK